MTLRTSPRGGAASRYRPRRNFRSTHSQKYKSLASRIVVQANSRPPLWLIGTFATVWQRGKRSPPIRMAWMRFSIRAMFAFTAAIAAALGTHVTFWGKGGQDTYAIWLPDCRLVVDDGLVLENRSATRRVLDHHIFRLGLFPLRAEIWIRTRILSPHKTRTLPDGSVLPHRGDCHLPGESASSRGERLKLTLTWAAGGRCCWPASCPPNQPHQISLIK